MIEYNLKKSKECEDCVHFHGWYGDSEEIMGAWRYYCCNLHNVETNVTPLIEDKCPNFKQKKEKGE